MTKKIPKIFQLLLLGMKLLICKISNCDRKTRKKLKKREPLLGLDDHMKPETSDFSIFLPSVNKIKKNI